MTMSIGSRVVRTTGIVVGPIAKPAYRLDVTTGRRVYIVGDQVEGDRRRPLLQGHPVPGVPLRLEGFADGSAATDSLGTAIWRTMAAISRDEDRKARSARRSPRCPAAPRRAEITAASREVLIFPSSRTVDADGPDRRRPRRRQRRRPSRRR